MACLIRPYDRERDAGPPAGAILAPTHSARFSTLRNVRCTACEDVEIAATPRRSAMSSGSGRLAIVALREGEEFARSRFFCRVVEHHDLVVRNALESQVLCGSRRVDNGLQIDAR